MVGHEQYTSHGRLQELERSECLELLASKQVGRVAWCGGSGPQVLPVNYTVVDCGILFRTSPYSQIEKSLYETRAAFQVDEIDDFLEAGWSVLVVGSPSYVSDPSDTPQNLKDRPEPWAPGVRNLYIRIEPESITGRRVHP